MKPLHFIRKSLRFHFRTHLGVVLGTAVGTAVLTGALLVGDSVRVSLHELALSRLGSTQVALSSGNRFFRSALAHELAPELDAPVAPALLVDGLAIQPERDRRCNRVFVLGVDDRFFRIGGCSSPLGEAEDQVVLNEALARRLEVSPGDEILLRTAKPQTLPGEAPLSIYDDASVAPRLVVKAVASREAFGLFNMRAEQVAPFNAFVPLRWLEDQLGLPGRANLLLVGERSTGPIDVQEANAALKQTWHLADAGLELRVLHGRQTLELRSDRVFMDSPAAEAAARAEPGALGVFSYFVNTIEKDELKTPYSVVTALGFLDKEGEKTGTDVFKIAPGTAPPWTGSILPSDMGKDDLLITRWLADDLAAGPGDALEMKYYVLGPGRKLEERSAAFNVRSVLPMEGAVPDPTLMPPFPGLSEKESCSDWEPGIDIDLSMIRPGDEKYWTDFKGAPKAFIALSTGQALWGNRFGSLTAVRYPLREGGYERVERFIRRELNLPSMGLAFQPVRERALRASNQALDFGQLFLGLSFFLIAGALILTGMLFALGMEQRSEERGTLLALGLTRKVVGRLALAEGMVLAVAGALLGAAGSVLYTRLTVHGLATLWKDAVSGSTVTFHWSASTLLIGALIGMLMAAVTMAVMSRRQGRQRIRALLDTINDSLDPSARTAGANGKTGWILAAAAAAGAVLLLIFMGLRGEGTGAGAFFGAGSLLLVAAMGVIHGVLHAWAHTPERPRHSLTGLAVINAARRRGRSLGVVGMLACGSFLVFAVGANRSVPGPEDTGRSSGTGGFALIGESALPVMHDLNSPGGRKEFGLQEEAAEDVVVVPLRVRAGDDASCLNLNRAQNPVLLGVNPEILHRLEAFTFAGTLKDADVAPWLRLNELEKSSTVPAIADHATILWALGKKLGDTLRYVDERGRPFKVKLVGALKNSVLQGSILVSEEAFIRRYPSENGYRMFLVDAPFDKGDVVAAAYGRAGRNLGLELESTFDRLERFYAVQNTYLSIFQILGGLGMLLGSVGLAFLVLRNVLERRSELAMLRAVGFSRRMIGRLLLYEHGWLLLLGLLSGVLAAGVAVWPALRAGGDEIPYLSLAATLAVMAAGGMVWIWIAAKAAVRGELLGALRGE